MVKVLALVGVLAVFYVAIIWKNEPETPANSPDNSPSYDFQSLSQPETLGVATISSVTGLGNTYVDEVMKFKIKYPEGVSVEKEKDNTLVITKDTLLIHISAADLPEKETVNTMAEKFINENIEKLADRFQMVETISPVSIGADTAVTFTTEVDSNATTYFYVPHQSRYLIIINLTDSTDRKMVSVSDDIIYSLELLQ